MYEKETHPVYNLLDNTKFELFFFINSIVELLKMIFFNVLLSYYKIILKKRLRHLPNYIFVDNSELISGNYFH